MNEDKSLEAAMHQGNTTPETDLEMILANEPNGTSTKTRKSLRAEIAIHPAIENYLRAIGSEANCFALNRVNLAVSNMAMNKHCGELLPRAKEWFTIIGDVDLGITYVRTSKDWGDEVAALFSPIDDTAFEGMYRALAYVSRLDISALARASIDKMTLAMIMVAASQGLVISQAIGYGIRQCYRALANDRKNAWHKVAMAATTDCAKLKQLIDPTNSGVVNEFLDACHNLLALELKAPVISDEVKADETSESNITAQTANQNNSDAGRQSKTFAPKELPQDKERKQQEVTAPTISAMVRTSQVAPMATKAGMLYQWDFLNPHDLRILTKKLAATIDGPDELYSAFATLALASLELRANAKSAVLIATEKTPLDARGDLWIDIERGCKSWVHSAYTSVAKPDTALKPSEARLQNDIPLSIALDRGLKLHTLQNGVLPTLKESLKEALQGAASNLKPYNSFLRELGDQAHLAEPSRFAHSLGAAFLSITGSDMLSALCALNFEVTAPSALFYFSPSTQYVHQQCDRVFRYLGMEGAVEIKIAANRMGAQP